MFIQAGRVRKILTARLILSRIVVGVAADRVSHLARDGLAANILVTVVVVPVRTIARRQHQQEQTPDLRGKLIKNPELPLLTSFLPTYFILAERTVASAPVLTRATSLLQTAAAEVSGFYLLFCFVCCCSL